MSILKQSHTRPKSNRHIKKKNRISIGQVAMQIKTNRISIRPNQCQFFRFVGSHPNCFLFPPPLNSEGNIAFKEKYRSLKGHVAEPFPYFSQKETPMFKLYKAISSQETFVSFCEYLVSSQEYLVSFYKCFVITLGFGKIYIYIYNIHLFGQKEVYIYTCMQIELLDKLSVIYIFSSNHMSLKFDHYWLNYP